MNLAIGIITRDRPKELASSLRHHNALAKRYGIKLYVFDNSVKTDNSELIKQYPDIRYHKHSVDLKVDDSFEYALYNIDADYRWVISDRPLITLGSIPYIMDYLSMNEYAAVVVGMGNRLVLNGETLASNDPVTVMQKVGWHATLISSTIYNKKILEAGDYSKYKGHDYFHLAIFLDGITRVKLPVLMIPASFLIKEDMTPAWLFQHMRLWCKELFEMVMKLPYEAKYKIQLLQATGTGGKVLSKEALQYLIVVGALDHKILNEYGEWFDKISLIPREKVHNWIDTIPEGTAE